MFFVFSGQEGRKGWLASYTCLGRGWGGGGGLFVYWINTVISLSLDCHLNKVSVTWCTDDDDNDDDDDDDEQTYCLSTEDDNQLPVCFIATLYQAKMFIVEGHWQLKVTSSWVTQQTKQSFQNTTMTIIPFRHLNLQVRHGVSNMFTNFEHLPWVRYWNALWAVKWII